MSVTGVTASALLGDPTSEPAPDINAALEAGYSYAEIADHLAEMRGADIKAAREAGYNDLEIVDHFVPKGNPVTGAVQAGAHLVTGGVAKVAGDLAGLGTTAYDAVFNAVTGNLDSHGEGVKQAVQDAMTYAPRTQRGAEYVGDVNTIIGKTIGRVANAAGDAAVSGANAVGINSPVATDMIRNGAVEATQQGIGLAGLGVGKVVGGALRTAAPVIGDAAATAGESMTSTGAKVDTVFKGPFGFLAKKASGVAPVNATIKVGGRVATKVSDKLPSAVERANIADRSIPPGEPVPSRYDLRHPNEIIKIQGEGASIFNPELPSAVEAANQLRKSAQGKIGNLTAKLNRAKAAGDTDAVTSLQTEIESLRGKYSSN